MSVQATQTAMAAGILIPLRGKDGNPRAYAIIDVADEHQAQFTWCLLPTGYVARKLRNGRGSATVYLHREILGLTKGDDLEGDHRDRDKLNNRRSNLRVCTRAENAQNLPGRGGTSIHRGVSWDAARGQWQARVGLAGRTLHLGRFDDELAAAEAAAHARAELMTHAVPTAQERNSAPCGCDGSGQVHHGEGPLSYVTRCRDRDCGLRRDAEFMGVSREDTARYFGTPA